MQDLRRETTLKEDAENLFGSIDLSFLWLRIFVLFAGFGWLYFAPLSRVDKVQSLLVFLFFSFYTAALYVTIFFNLERIRVFYLVGLLFDLVFIFLLMMFSGGAASSIFISFYILVALHSFYYGIKVGLVVSAASGLFYFVSYVDSGFPFHWTDFILRVLFMFILSVTAGFLSMMMKHDRTQISQLNNELRASLASLEKAQIKLIETAKLAALGRMTSDVAHEIRNPLVTIGGYARRCNARMDPSSQEKKYSKIIVDEVERLEKILRDLLVFSRGPHHEPRKISIPPLLEKSLGIHSEEIREKKIRVVREFGEHLPELLGDEEQLGQALSNMISNAEQAMTSGGLLTVRAYARTEDETVNIIIEIQDTGKGIPEENLGLIFNPFFSTKHEGEGTGLGLSVSRRIVEEHNGRIHVESTVGKGSTFTIVLPLHTKEEHTARSREENQE